MDGDIQKNIASRPTWIARQDGAQTCFDFVSIVAFDMDGSRSQEASNVGKYMDALTADSSQKERMDAYVMGLPAAGQGKPAREAIARKAPI